MSCPTSEHFGFLTVKDTGMKRLLSVSLTPVPGRDEKKNEQKTGHHTAQQNKQAKRRSREKKTSVAVAAEHRDRGAWSTLPPNGQ